MISTDNANVTGLSILLEIPPHSNQAQNQTSDLTAQALLIYCSLKHLQPCPSAGAIAPFQWYHHLPPRSHPKQLIARGKNKNQIIQIECKNRTKLNGIMGEELTVAI